VPLRRCCLTAGWLTLCLGFRAAGEPGPLVPPPRKEPPYQTKAPRYCLAVFGPRAELRVWLVLDGRALYADRNGNGDLTEPGERVAPEEVSDNGRHLDFETFDVAGPFGGPTYRLWVRTWEGRAGRWELLAVAIVAQGNYRELAEEAVAWGERPPAAPVLAFGRPLAVRPAHADRLAFRPGAARVALHARLEPLAGGPEGRAGGTAVLTEPRSVPRGLGPLAEVEFPARGSSGEPLRVAVRLAGRDSCDCCFTGDVPVPRAAAAGRARVTLSFPEWKDVRVAPSHFEVPVTDAPPPK
jgi:hypothetical protein